MTRAPRVRIGTSGWSYDHWAGNFYPEHLDPAGRLAYYATRFDTVEVNATFYRLPTEQAVRNWHEEVPPGFAFSVKGSRYITHIRRLANAEEPAETFLRRVSLLGKALEVVLWQLPPNFKLDAERLDRFLAGLAAADAPNAQHVRHAVEFRHESWLVDEAFEVLRKHKAAHVHVSSDEMPANLTPTADFVYLRFHGTEEYHGAYTHPALEPWAAFLGERISAERDVYAYFNNDFEGHAPRDAERLREMLGDAAAPE